MIINHNLSAMNAHRNLLLRIDQTDKTAEKLASGLRINRAADDAAGLAVSEKMRGQIRGLAQASRNVQDGISLVQTAEGYLQAMGDILQRMRELAVQSANGIYTASDRMQIQVEISQLVDELDRIASHAEFNTKNLLRGGQDHADPTTHARVDGIEPGQDQPYPLEEPEGGVTIHLGANVDQREKVFIQNVSPQMLGIADGAGDSRQLKVDYLTVEGSNKAIEQTDLAVQEISRQRANLGAFQNRLEAAMKGIDIAHENLQAAESRIRDTDMAKFMVDYVRDVILTQSSSVMLTHANMRPQLILTVLKG